MAGRGCDLEWGTEGKCLDYFKINLKIRFKNKFALKFIVFYLHVGESTWLCARDTQP